MKFVSCYLCDNLVKELTFGLVCSTKKMLSYNSLIFLWAASRSYYYIFCVFLLRFGDVLVTRRPVKMLAGFANGSPHPVATEGGACKARWRLGAQQHFLTGENVWPLVIVLRWHATYVSICWHARTLKSRASDLDHGQPGTWRRWAHRRCRGHGTHMEEKRRNRAVRQQRTTTYDGRTTAPPA